MKTTFTNVLTLLVLVSLSACGGGGTEPASSAAPVPTVARPLANAGSAQSVLVGASVTLNGSASTDTNNPRLPLTYAWTLASRPSGSAAVLAGSASMQPTFTADLAGTYMATLVVNNGTSASESASVPITATPASAAYPAAAQLNGTFDVATSQLTLNWKNSFPNALAYQVQILNPQTGSFSAVQTITAAATVGGAMSWSGTVPASGGSAVYQVLASIPGDSVPLLSTQGSTSITVKTNGAAEIVLDQAEPVAKEVRLSTACTSNCPTGEIFWILRGQFFGSGNSIPVVTQYYIPPGTVNYSVYTIPVAAKYQAGSTDVYYVISKNVRAQQKVPQPILNATFSASDYALYGTSGNVSAKFSVPDGGYVTSIKVTMDGRELIGNRCTVRLNNVVPWCGPDNPFGLSINYPVPFALAGGPHVIDITVTDGNQQTTTKSFPVTYPYYPAPTLVLASPADGASVRLSLLISGTATAEPQGSAVTVTARIGNVQIFQSTSSPFSFNYSLAGVLPGTYALAVQAVDSGGKMTSVTRSITVTN